MSYAPFDLSGRLSGNGQEESFVVAAIWTLVRPLRSVNGPSTTDDVHPVIGHSHHPQPGKYFGREWPLSRKSNVPWVSENCRVEQLLPLSDSVAPPYRVHTAYMDTVRFAKLILM
ncbi:hypothetical protein [Paraburkholderia sp. GAS42]|uniref:hypothetical protein n=1 Tax=Paraburkholderia sp. GAS42 TaxID=3035135 RepID=UPI003D24D4B7